MDHDIDDILQQLDSLEFREQIVKTPYDFLPVNQDFLKGINEEQRKDLLFGEYLYLLGKNINKLSSKYLKRGQWGYETPDWFDHRHHTLNWEEESKNGWLESAAMVLRHLPKDGTIFNIGAGDAWFDKNIFSKMARQIVCIDIKINPYKEFVEHVNSNKKIIYIVGDIIETTITNKTFDVVVMRSVIEHFNKEQQKEIMIKIKNCLKPGGWFVGDTPANPNQNKMHNEHKYEWANKEEAYSNLAEVFTNPNVYSILCNVDPRETIFWECQI